MRKIMTGLIISLIILIPLYFFTSPGEEPVSIFVLDSGFSPVVREGSGRTLRALPGHGQLVLEIVSDTKRRAPAELYALEVVPGPGESSRQSLKNQLRRVRDYARNNQQTRVFVNISLAFWGENEEERRLFQELQQAGVIVVAAAGNTGDNQVAYPARYSSVLAVTAAGSRGRETYASYGEEVDLAASGDVTRYLPAEFSSYSLNPYRSTGTSFAAPRVVGGLAEIAATLGLEVSSAELIDQALDFASPIDDPLYEEDLLGAGFFEREKLLRSLAPGSYWHTRIFYLLVVNLALLLLVGGKLFQQRRFARSLADAESIQRVVKLTDQAEEKHWPHIKAKLETFSEQERRYFARQSFQLEADSTILQNFWQQQEKEFLAETLAEILPRKETDPEKLAEKVFAAAPQQASRLATKLEEEEIFRSIYPDNSGKILRFRLALLLALSRYSQAQRLAREILQKSQQVWVLYYALYALQETGLEGLDCSELEIILDGIMAGPEPLLRQEASKLKKRLTQPKSEI